MKAGSISTNINFGRAIKIDSTTSPMITRNIKEVDGNTKEIETVLNSNHSKKYKKVQCEKIRGFFRQALGDYNGKNGIIFRLVDGNIILLSGKEAEEIKALEDNRDEYMQNIVFNFGVNSPMFKKAENIIQDKINEYLEDGKNGKPESKFEFTSSYLIRPHITTAQLTGEKPITSVIDKIRYTTNQQKRFYINEGNDYFCERLLRI